MRKTKTTEKVKLGSKAPFPRTISPMLATLTDKPIEGEGWLYEVKWDGYRAIALCHKGKVELISRNNKSFNDKYYPVYQAIKEWGIEGIIDGEICVLNEKGLSHFGSLQNWRSEVDGNLVYYVFDLLYLNGDSLMQVPLQKRRQLLKSIVPKSSIIRYSETFDHSGVDFLKTARELGMEGVMAKKADSVYVPGERTQNWLKIKANKRHEVVIGGYTNNEDSPKLFSALLVGVYEKGKLLYTGKIGTGFTGKMQQDMMKLFKPLKRKTCPFTELPDVNKPSRFRPDPPHATVTWLLPELVCEVSYAEITADKVMRHPSFEGMRTDKPAKSVVAETLVKSAEIGKGVNTKKIISKK